MALFPKSARAFSIADKPTSNPHATAYLRHILRRIRALLTVAAFVCQMRESILRIFSLCNL